MKSIGTFKKGEDHTFSLAGHVNGELCCIFVTKKKDKTEVWEIKRPESEEESLIILGSMK